MKTNWRNDVGKSISIGHLRFRTKKLAIDHFRGILNRYDNGATIADEDVASIQALLFHRPEKVAELGGRAVVRYLRKTHRHNTDCFFAELDDGTLLDISFKKWIEKAAFDKAA